MKTIFGRSARTILHLISMATWCLSSLAWADSAMVTNSANGHSYKRFDTPTTWQQARTACASRGAHLATLSSAQENEFLVAQFLPANTFSWLGASDDQTEGVWRWVTGETWSYENWYPGEPNDGLPEFAGEDYLSTSSFIGGKWNDAGGPAAPQLTYPFICEWERLYESLATLSDITGDAIPDYATVYREAGNIFLLISNGATGAPIKRTVIGAESTLSSVSLSAASGDISVLLSRSNGTAAIQVRDEVTLALTATITVR